MNESAPTTAKRNLLGIVDATTYDDVVERVFESPTTPRSAGGRGVVLACAGYVHARPAQTSSYLRNLVNPWLDEGETAVKPGNCLKAHQLGADAQPDCSVHSEPMEPTSVTRKRQDIKLPPQADPDQAYHWTPEWEAGEREVEAELSSGHFQVYASIDDMFDDMDRAAS